MQLDGLQAKKDAVEGKIVTVLGPIEPEDVGPTLMHEHLLWDLTALFERTFVPAAASAREVFYADFTPELAGPIKYQGIACIDNNRNRSVDLAIAEASLFARAGGRTIVDVTNHGLARDPGGLAEIARGTGLNIVMGSSWYVEPSLPVPIDDRSEDDLCREIVHDVLVGVGATGVQSGIIGEVGCSWPLTPNEKKALRASARAQRLTGAPLTIHPGRDESAPMEIVGILDDAGADLSRTVIDHLERTFVNHSAFKELAETGVILEFDLFGTEWSFYRANPAFDMPNDGQRLEWLSWLISEGHGDQIVVSHDIDGKHMMSRYGGFGYAHILRNIVPRMRAKGFDEDTIDAILVRTPQRLLTFDRASEPLTAV